MTSSVTKQRSAKRRDGDVVRAYTYPLHPTPEQAETMTRWLDGCRWLWNQAVEHNQRRWAARVGVETAQALSAAIPLARKFDGSPLADVPGTWAQGTLRQQGDAWALHWSKRKAGKETSPPKFRAAHRPQSVRFNVQENSQPATPGYLIRATDTGSVRFSQVRIVKLGWVIARIDRPLPKDALCGSMVVNRDALGRWWVTFQCEIPKPRRAPTGQVAGVDRGVAHSLVTDTGQVLDAPGMTPGEARRRLKLERSLARTRRQNPCPADRWVGKKLIRGQCECGPGECWKQSNRYQQTKMALAKIREREAARRRDAGHKASAVLAAENDVVVFEDLNVQAMTRSAKGTPEAPGSNVAAKQGLNRSITSQIWGSVKAKTVYKTQVVVVPAHHTSQTDSDPACGHVDPASRRSQSLFVCTACGRVDNADRNAAANIRQRGIELLAGEETSPAATQAVAGRGGDHAGGPENRQRSRNRREGDSCRTPGDSGTDGAVLVPLVPEHWGINAHRVQRARRAQRARRRVAFGRCNETEGGVTDAGH